MAQLLPTQVFGPLWCECGCGRHLVQGRGRTPKYATGSCAKRVYRAQGRVRPRPPVSPRQSACDWCGAAVNAYKRKSTHRTFCSDDHSRWHYLWRNHGPLSKPVPVAHAPLRGSMVSIFRCAWCGHPGFSRTGRRRLFCSERCMRAKPGAVSQVYRVMCRGCGDEFVSRRDSGAWCSLGCRKARGRYPVSPKRRSQIYRRDGFECQICHEMVDLMDFEIVSGSDGRPAMVAGPMYPSLDHIVPQSLGGEHHSSNLRTAHHRCNSERGNEWLVGQLSLLQ